MMSNESPEKIHDLVCALLDRFEPALVGQEMRDDFDAGLNAMFDDDLKTDVHAAFQQSVEKIEEALASSEGPILYRSNERERSLLRRLVANLGAGVKMAYCYKQAELGIDPNENRLEAALVRESVLADNVLWLARERYPDRKMIVWGANSHLLYNTRSVELKNREGEWEPDTHPWLPMGNRVRENLQDTYYVIQFIAFEGEHAMITQQEATPLAPADPGSMEALCEATGEKYLFVDLTAAKNDTGGLWLMERLIASPRRYVPARAVWPDVCDAFFFTRTMFRATPKAAQGEETGE